MRDSTHLHMLLFSLPFAVHAWGKITPPSMKLENPSSSYVPNRGFCPPETLAVARKTGESIAFVASLAGHSVAPDI